MSDKFSRIANVSSETRESILRKSVRDLPNSPSAAGMSAFDLKRYFYQLVTDGNYSALAELQRVIDEVNSTFGQIEASDDDFAKKLEEAIQSISKKAEATALEKEISDRSAADSALQEKIESAQGTADEALEKANSIDLSGYYTKTDVDEILLKKVDDTDLEEEKSTRESADTEIKASIESVSNSIPKNTSQLTNDSGFITKVVTDLVNYYTKAQVDSKLSQIPKFTISVVSELPTQNISTTTVYLVKDMQDTGNLYTEYIYVDGVWEKLGSQTVDLTGYATETWVNAQIADTAYQKPATGIPESDLSQEVQDKLNESGGGGGAELEIGTVSTETLDAGMDAEVDVETRIENGSIYVDWRFGLPRGLPGPDGVGIASVALQGMKFTITYTDGESDEVSIDTQDIAIVRELGTVDGADTVKMPDGSYKSIKEAILALAHPVGTIYASVNNTSPASFLGGTWEALTTDATEYKWKRTA